jgi:hypothetical protein
MGKYVHNSTWGLSIIHVVEGHLICKVLASQATAFSETDSYASNPDNAVFVDILNAI